MKKLIIIPAYNEERNILGVIEDVLTNATGFDYIIVNDCSTDNTINLCKENGLNVLNLPTNLGIGGCVQAGYKYARENGYDIAIQFDGDGQHNAKYIETLYKAMLEKKYDMIIGSRFITNLGFQSSAVRRMGIKFLSQLIQRITKTNISDPTSGLRIINKEVIEIFCKYYPVDYPEPESIVSLCRMGFKIGEVPVIMNERNEGSSSISPSRSLYYMVKVSLAIIIDFLKTRKGKEEEVLHGT